jgi:Uncharacterised nucleotidyltransferase
MDPLATTQKFPQTSLRQAPSQQAEWLALLQCAAPCPDLNRLAGLVRDPFSWPLFLQHAGEHRVVPLVAAGGRDLDQALIPPELRDKLRELDRAHTLAALQLTAELFRLLAHFANAGIQVLITKGPALAVRCYDEPGMRQYGDLDVVIREADIRVATQTMLQLTYEPRVPLSAINAQKTVGEYAFLKPGTDLLVEFHTERTFRYHPRPLQIEKLFERSAYVVIDGRDVPVLSLEDELVLICVHGAKHFWERLMWIADAAALISRQAMDWNRALAVANEVGAQRILRLGLCLAADLLGAELPVHLEATVQSDRTVAKLAAQIESRLAHRELHEIGIFQRAAFRVRMRGGLLSGLAYLLRLSLTPTEEDWTRGREGDRRALVDAISRPLRLARKHSRPSSK